MWMSRGQLWSTTSADTVFKEVSKTGQFNSFHLQLPGHQDIPPLSFALRHQL